MDTSIFAAEDAGGGGGNEPPDPPISDILDLLDEDLKPAIVACIALLKLIFKFAILIVTLLYCVVLSVFTMAWICLFWLQTRTFYFTSSTLRRMIEQPPYAPTAVQDTQQSEDIKPSLNEHINANAHVANGPPVELGASGDVTPKPVRHVKKTTEVAVGTTGSNSRDQDSEDAHMTQEKLPEATNAPRIHRQMPKNITNVNGKQEQPSHIHQAGDEKQDIAMNSSKHRVTLPDPSSLKRSVSSAHLIADKSNEKRPVGTLQNPRPRQSWKEPPLNLVLPPPVSESQVKKDVSAVSDGPKPAMGFSEGQLTEAREYAAQATKGRVRARPARAKQQDNSKRKPLPTVEESQRAALAGLRAAVSASAASCALKKPQRLNHPSTTMPSRPEISGDPGKAPMSISTPPHLRSRPHVVAERDSKRTPSPIAQPINPAAEAFKKSWSEEPPTALPVCDPGKRLFAGPDRYYKNTKATESAIGSLPPPPGISTSHRTGQEIFDSLLEDDYNELYDGTPPKPARRRVDSASEADNASHTREKKSSTREVDSMDPFAPETPSKASIDAKEQLSLSKYRISQPMTPFNARLMEMRDSGSPAQKAFQNDESKAPALPSLVMNTDRTSTTSDEVSDEFPKYEKSDATQEQEIGDTDVHGQLEDKTSSSASSPVTVIAWNDRSQRNDQAHQKKKSDHEKGSTKMHNNGDAVGDMADDSASSSGDDELLTLAPTQQQASETSQPRDTKAEKLALLHDLKEAWCDREEVRCQLREDPSHDGEVALQHATDIYHEKRILLLSIRPDNEFSANDNRVFPIFSDNCIDAPKCKPSGTDAILKMRQADRERAAAKKAAFDEAHDNAIIAKRAVWNVFVKVDDKYKATKSSRGGGAWKVKAKELLKEFIDNYHAKIDELDRVLDGFWAQELLDLFPRVSMEEVIKDFEL